MTKQTHNSAEVRPEAPSLPAHIVLGKSKGGVWRNLLAARKNVLEILPKGTLQHDILSSSMLGRRFHLLTDPDGLRHVLKNKVDLYPKSPETSTVLHKAMGKSLFLAQGEEWRFQRRAAAPVFVPRNMKALAPVMSEAAREARHRLEGRSNPVDIGGEMLRTAFDVIAQVSFAGPSAVPREVILAAIDDYLDRTGKVSLLDFLGLPRWVPRPARIFMGRALRETKARADEAIEARRKHPNPGDPTLLDLLIDAEDPETGRRMTTEELRDNLITFLIAGHETTALTLSWALYLLAYAPNFQKRARSEARAALSDRVATYDDIEKLPYLRKVLYETMRLYPPIPLHLRTARAQDEICGTEIRPGDTIIIPIWSLHRSIRFWEFPNQFRPGRFDDMSKIDRFAYIPFLGGPRICLGADFAMTEMLIVLSTLLARYKFSLVPDRLPVPNLILSLRSSTGFWLNVEPA